MHKTIILVSALGLASCGQPSNNAAESNAAANAAAREKPEPAAYCFFKDSETKGWSAKADKEGDVVVSGRAFREDARYKAQLSPATISGTTAQVAPTIAPNDTGFAAPNNWWDISETIPNSREVATVVVKCGDETLASLTVPRKK